MNGLPGVDQPFDHLSRDTKAEIALDPGGDDTRECPLGGFCRLGDRDPDELLSLTGVALDRRRRSQADCCRRPEADHCGQNGGGEERNLAVVHGPGSTSIADATSRVTLISTYSVVRTGVMVGHRLRRVGLM